MTVAELRAKLATFDPDALVVLSDADGYSPSPLSGIDEGQFDCKRVYSARAPLATGVECVIFYPAS